MRRKYKSHFKNLFIFTLVILEMKTIANDTNHIYTYLK